MRSPDIQNRTEFKETVESSSDSVTFDWLSVIQQIRSNKLTHLVARNIKRRPPLKIHTVKVSKESDSITAFAVLKNGTLMIGHDSGVVSHWDIKRGVCLGSLKEHTGTINALVELSDGTVASASADSMVKHWNLKTYQCIDTWGWFMTRHGGSVLSLALAQDDTVLSGSTDGTIKQWDPKAGKCIATWQDEKHKSVVIMLGTLEDGSVLSVRNGVIQQWDPKSGQLRKNAENSALNLSGTLCVLKNGVIFCEGARDSVTCFDFKANKTTTSWNPNKINLEGLQNAVAIVDSTDHSMKLKIWDREAGPGFSTWKTKSGLSYHPLLDGTVVSVNRDTIEHFEFREKDLLLSELVILLEQLKTTILKENTVTQVDLSGTVLDDSCVTLLVDLITKNKTVKVLDVRNTKMTLAKQCALLEIAKKSPLELKIHSDALTFSEYQKAAVENDVKAQMILGQLFEDGIGFARNPVEAAAWYQKAAAQGNAAAQVKFGLFCEKGIGVEKNYIQAAQWLRKAVEQKHDGAHAHLQSAELKPIDDLLVTANSGDGQSLYELGLMIEKGLNVPRDTDKALEYFRKAAAASYAPAQKYLEMEQKQAECQTLLKQAEAGEVKAQCEISQRFRSGLMDELFPVHPIQTVLAEKKENKEVSMPSPEKDGADYDAIQEQIRENRVLSLAVKSVKQADLKQTPQRIKSLSATINSSSFGDIQHLVMVPFSDSIIFFGEGLSIKQFDLLSGECLKVFKGHHDRVTTLLVLKDGTLLTKSEGSLSAVLNHDYNNKLDGEVTDDTEAHHHNIALRNGRLLSDYRKYSAFYDPGSHMAWVVFCSSITQINTLQGYGYFVIGTMENPQQLFYRHEDGWLEEIKVNDANHLKKNLVSLREISGGSYSEMRVKADGFNQYSAGFEFKRWDIKTGVCINSWKGDDSSCLAELEDGTVISFPYNNDANQWDPNTGKVLSSWKFNAKGFWTSPLLVHPKGYVFVSKGHGGKSNLGQYVDNESSEIVCWDAKTGKVAATWREEGARRTYSLALLKDGTLVSSGDHGPQRKSHRDKCESFETIRHWSLNGRLLALWEGGGNDRHDVYGSPLAPKTNFLCVLSDGSVISAWDTVIRRWDPQTHKPIDTWADSAVITDLKVVGSRTVLSVTHNAISIWQFPDLDLSLEKVHELLISLFNNSSCKAVSLYQVPLEDSSISILLELINKNHSLIEIDLRKTKITVLEYMQLLNAANQRTVKFQLLCDGEISAFIWSERAAQTGDAEGQMLLAHCYELGVGIKSDFHQAITWCQKAADQGHAPAIAHLRILKEKMQTSGLGLSESSPTRDPLGLSSKTSQRDSEEKKAEMKTSLQTTVTAAFQIPHSELKRFEKVGQGGFGVVYRGEWRRTPVAIKELHAIHSKESVEEFQREGRIMVELRHPNIVQFCGFCPDPRCLVMEWMPNGSLYSVLHSDRPLDAAMRFRFVVDIAKGLDFLHACSPPILHRDLKSLNILLDEFFRAKICDFGLSKIKSETRATSTVGGAIGTPAWTAPEMAKRGAEYTSKADIFSFAMVMWEIYSRKIPFADALNPSLILMWVVNGDREKIPDDCPKKIASLMVACWKGRPEERPEAKEIVDYLSSSREEFESKSSASAMASHKTSVASQSSAVYANLESQRSSSGVSLSSSQ